MARARITIVVEDIGTENARITGKSVYAFDDGGVEVATYCFEAGDVTNDAGGALADFLELATDESITFTAAEALVDIDASPLAVRPEPVPAPFGSRLP